MDENAFTMIVPLDELSFLNRQLAAMLRDGLPLEGALREICQSMGRTELKQELQKLEADLASGIPLVQALPARRLPEFYVQTVLAGVKGHDLPGVLTLLADYYGKVHSIWTRLKGLMVYPALVLMVSLLVTGWMAFLQHSVSTEFIRSLTSTSQASQRAAPVALSVPLIAIRPSAPYIWMPPVTVLTLAAIGVGLLGFRRTRHALRWRLPAFKEASLSQLASSLHLLLKSGSTFHEALGFLLPIEKGTPAGVELQQWRKRLEEGNGKFPSMAQDSRLFPPLFLWLASSSGDDLAAGFERAAEVYRQRASYRIDVLLHAALPASMLVLGLMVLLQIYPITSKGFESLSQVFNMSQIIQPPAPAPPTNRPK